MSSIENDRLCQLKKKAKTGFSITVRTPSNILINLLVSSNTLLRCGGTFRGSQSNDDRISTYTFEEFLVNEMIQSHSWDRRFAIIAVGEYTRFLELKITETDYNGKHFSPSLIIDEIWHTHILNTAKYEKNCKEIHDQVANDREFQFIHHFTERARDPAEVIANRREHFLVHYQQNYSTTPPVDVWKNTTNKPINQSCKHCIACRVYEEDGTPNDMQRILMTVYVYPYTAKLLERLRLKRMMSYIF